METVKGKRIVYLYRIYSKRTTETGATLAFTTENTKSVSKDAETTATKDGTIRTPGDAEIELSVTSLLAKGDTMVKALQNAMLNDELIEVWEANLDDPATSENKFNGTYYQGYITSIEISANAEDFVEVSMDIGINGNGADGEVTVTEEQQEAALYAFSDTTLKTGA